jgi:hypothetical protein
MHLKRKLLIYISINILILFLSSRIVMSFSQKFPIAGTAVVFIWTPHNVFLATDSQQTDPEHPGKFEKTCKILITPKFVFASAGLSELAAIRFNVKLIAREANQQAGEPREIVESFEKLLAPQLKDALEFARTHVPKIYNQHYKNCIVIHGLFAFPTDPPTVIVTSMRSNDSSGEIKLEHLLYECPNPKSDPQLEWNAYGHIEGLSQFLADKTNYFKTRDPALAAHDLVQAAINSMPEYVAPPIVVIRITKGNISWVERSEICR